MREGRAPKVGALGDAGRTTPGMEEVELRREQQLSCRDASFCAVAITLVSSCNEFGWLPESFRDYRLPLSARNG